MQHWLPAAKRSTTAKAKNSKAKAAGSTMRRGSKTAKATTASKSTGWARNYSRRTWHWTSVIDIPCDATTAAEKCGFAGEHHKYSQGGRNSVCFVTLRVGLFIYYTVGKSFIYFKICIPVISDGFLKYSNTGIYWGVEFWRHGLTQGWLYLLSECGHHVSSYCQLEHHAVVV